MSFAKNVYFLRPEGQDGPIKIGCSMLPLRRLKEIANWSPLPLEMLAFVPGTHDDERYLHRCFSALHSHQEWFHASPELLSTIAKVAAAGTVDAVRGTLSEGASIVHRQRIQITDEQKRRRSYSHRLRWARKRMGKCEPHECESIMSRWYGSEYFGVKGVAPTPSEIAQLEAYLSSTKPQSDLSQDDLERKAA